MLRNYLTTAFRVLARQRLYSAINIIGLSVGLSASLLISIYIVDELRYDKHFSDAENIYRIGINETFSGDEILYSSVCAPLAETMITEMPEVTDVVRFTRLNNTLLAVDDQSFIDSQLFVGDSNFFKFFGLPLVAGDPATALVGLNKLVLSVSSAKKYYGYDGTAGTSPVGKQIRLGAKGDLFEVTGVFADFPEQTHFKPNIIASLITWPFAQRGGWSSYNVKTYFKLRPDATVGRVEDKLNSLVVKHILPSIEGDLKLTHDQFVASGDHVSMFTQRLTDIHLRSNISGEFEANGDIRYVSTFIVVACSLILLACINFMNLATARAFSRAKEVGVRKTMGATRAGLVPQFMLESFLYVFMAGVLAIGLAYALLSKFNLLSGKALVIDLWSDPYLVGAVLLVLLLVGVLAGSYPSFYLTAFKPAVVLKGSAHSGSHKSMLRSGLVVFQFAVSICLIISTLIIQKQVAFVRNQNLGFEKENVLKINQGMGLGSNYATFKEELLSHAEFVNVGVASQLPPSIESTTFIKGDDSPTLISTYLHSTDHDLLKTMGYEMKTGRYFSKGIISDSNAVVLNEACARMLGFSSHEGHTINFGGEEKWNVIGVVKDFNFASLKSTVQPLSIFLNNTQRMIAVRLTPGDVEEKISLAESIWKKHSNGKPFLYSFVDMDFDGLFRAEQRMGKVFAVFAFIAIFIACLGLLGLITFVSAQRTKEIGIRKVMGANLAQIIVLLMSDLVKLVVVSLVISVPVAWYGADQWLQTFAYRIAFDPVAVLVAAGAGILLALATVTYRSVRAASANPVDSLKNE